MGDLSAFESVLRPMAISMHRERLVFALTPLFGTAEQRAAAQAQVDAKSDDEIEAMMRAWLEDVSKFCPECGRPYELTIATIEEREDALAAIHAYDVTHGRVVPLPGYDHVHRVTPDDAPDTKDHA